MAFDIQYHYLFYCGREDQYLPWVYAKIWPVFCPICGKGVSAVYSAHHEVVLNLGQVDFSDFL